MRRPTRRIRANELIDPIEDTDPIDPMEKTEPTLPIEAKLSLLPIERTERRGRWCRKSLASLHCPLLAPARKAPRTQ